jgi:hypothetical protein
MAAITAAIVASIAAVRAAPRAPARSAPEARAPALDGTAPRPALFHATHSEPAARRDGTIPGTPR